MVSRAELRIQGHPNAGQEKHSMKDMEHQSRNIDTKPAGVSKIRRPADAQGQKGEHRWQGQYPKRLTPVKNLVLVERESQNIGFLKTEVGFETSPERDWRDFSSGVDQRQQEVKQKSRSSPHSHAAEELNIEEAQPLGPHQGDKEQRQETDHRPVARHRQ